MSLIKRKIKLGKTNITATDVPDFGFFSFGKERFWDRITNSTNKRIEKTGAGAFKTMRGLIKSLEDIKPQRITYHACGKTEKEAKTKDKLYARELNRSGYSLRYTSDEVYLKDNNTHMYGGPIRIWWLKNKRPDLEEIAFVTSIILFFTGLFFLYPNLTGNAIGNLTKTSSNFIGGMLFILGVAGLFFINYLR
jgi:hypothetical protein